ncbi:gp56 [Synechococcus phage Syn5]|uniref:Gp56 n=1 Tax=Synechococcus phage Syn5 TaxID=2914003 RepID=A4ZRD7_9CAUD|nr:gp56 [Synechococcus phage Syn5]ABP87963.1 gp56 [Synechococcus phage Syn5]
METIVFNGVTYNVADLDPVALLYIQTYNKVTGSAPIIDPNTRDYDYRMSQALQMFGDPVVIESIQDLIDS